MLFIHMSLYFLCLENCLALLWFLCDYVEDLSYYRRCLYLYIKMSRRSASSRFFSEIYAKLGIIRSPLAKDFNNMFGFSDEHLYPKYRVKMYKDV